MANVSLTASAIQSLLQYYQRIELDSPTHAERFYKGIMARIDSLHNDALVHRGALVQNKDGKEIRYLIHKKHYLIYYEILPKGNVEVYALWHSSRESRPLNRL